MQRKTERPHKTPACITGLISCLEMCLDDLAKCGEFSKERRKAWLWIEQAMQAPPVMAAFQKLDYLDQEKMEYINLLLHDYSEAVSPKGVEDEEESKELMLF